MCVYNYNSIFRIINWFLTALYIIGIQFFTFFVIYYSQKDNILIVHKKYRFKLSRKENIQPTATIIQN